jgi:stalled ribosome rescue protein Dom34
VTGRHRYRRGFPVAVLVGFDEKHAILWRVFSCVVKKSITLELEGKRSDEKVLYNFYESVVELLKPILKEGIRTIVVIAPERTTFTKNFLEHVRKHHSYLIQSKNPNRAIFAELVGSASDNVAVAELVKTKEFRDRIAETTSEEADQMVNSLDKRLYESSNSSIVLYSLKEIEEIIYNQEKQSNLRSEYLLLTDKYLSNSKQKNRIHRLLQIAKNKTIKTRIIDAETLAGTRISQFGGIVYLSALTKK